MLDPEGIVLIAALLGLLSNIGACNGGNSSTSSVLSRLFEHYDKTLRPGHEGPPVIVSANMYVSSFGSIQETNMEYKLFGFFRQYWTDSRLAGKLTSTVILKGSEIDNLWKPDPFCNNARESNLRDSDDTISSMVFLHSDGSIMYSRLFVITAECNMDLHYFPMDQQKCDLKLSSYSYTTDHIVYKWRPSVLVGSKDLAQFHLKSLDLSNVTDLFVTGDFAAIIVTFTFERRLGYFLIQVYAPDIFVVMLSWIVFWMDRDDMGNRMALGITIILTIMFLLGSINAAMPRVSYPKALDWYLMVSFTFVFFSLVECIVVYCVGSTKPNKEKEQQSKNCNKHNAATLPNQLRLRKGSNMLHSNPGLPQTKPDNAMSHACLESLEENSNGSMAACRNIENGPGQQHQIPRDSSTRFYAEWIDMVSRVAFPLGFLIYNVGYWYTYLV